MKRHGILLLAGLLSIAACASRTAQSDDPISGKWSGDYESAPDRREPVTLELEWDNTTLRGEVQAVQRVLPIDKSSFKPETGEITMEFDAQANGRPVHYVIEGKVEGKTMTGTWSHDSQRGNFRITKE